MKARIGQFRQFVTLLAIAGSLQIVVPLGKRDVLVFDEQLPGFGIRKFDSGKASYLQRGYGILRFRDAIELDQPLGAPWRQPQLDRSTTRSTGPSSALLHGSAVLVPRRCTASASTTQ